MIWDTKIKEKIKNISVDIYDADGDFISQKNFYAEYKTNKKINDWYSVFYDNNGKEIGIMNTRGNDFQNHNYIRISTENNFNHTNIITINNLIQSCMYLAIRHCIEATWINDRDQFLYPAPKAGSSHDKWENDKEFQNDCLAFALFHGQNRISSSHGVNHWIPFSEDEVNSKKAFDSRFMKDFISGKIARHCEGLKKPEAIQKVDSFADARNDGLKYNSHCEATAEAIKNENLFETENTNFIPTKPLEFSKEAQDVFNAGLELWKYYHANANNIKYNANASLYDIKEYFQGRNEKGKMNNKSKDEEYNKLIGNLRYNLGILAKKIEPKIYEYGFLRE